MDRAIRAAVAAAAAAEQAELGDQPQTPSDQICLLYTSDAADEEDSVDLGGCRIIKKKKIPSKIITLHLKCSQRIIP